MLSDKTIIPVSETIAAHVSALRFDALSAATVHCTRRSLLDAIGVMLGASGLAEDALPYRAHALGGGPGPARLLGLSARTMPAAAALANGALGHALDYGDTFDAGPAHPSAAVVPALLALADADRGIDGGDLIAAMTAGTDLACRLSIAPARPFEEGGWYPPPLVGTIATATACARLLGCSTDGVRNAMGLALLQSSFPAEIKYDVASPVRAIREGWAARAGLEAAQLAHAGARAFAAPLEGKAGLFAIYGGGGPTARLTEGLGERFLGDAVSFKPWPSCRGTHPYIEAALALRARLGTQPIRTIEAEIGPIQEMLIRPQPAKAAPGSAIEAKFSIPFTVAHALVHGEVTLDSFGPAERADAQVLGLAARVTEHRRADWGREHAASGALTVTLENGTVLRHDVPQALGHPDRPLSDADLIEKFTACAAKAAEPVAPDRARDIASRILALGPGICVADLLD